MHPEDGVKDDGAEEDDFEFDDEPCIRDLDDIVSEETEALYRGSDDIRSAGVEEYEFAHAICHVVNEAGEEGWAIVSARGSSWEGLYFRTSYVYATYDEASRVRSDMIKHEREEFDEELERRRAEREAEEADEDDA